MIKTNKINQKTLMKMNRFIINNIMNSNKINKQEVRRERIKQKNRSSYNRKININYKFKKSMPWMMRIIIQRNKKMKKK